MVRSLKEDLPQELADLAAGEPQSALKEAAEVLARELRRVRAVLIALREDG